MVPVEVAEMVCVWVRDSRMKLQDVMCDFLKIIG